MASFKLYRIVNTLNAKALVSGSDYPARRKSYPPYASGPWYDRGYWSDTGAFWKTEATVRRHLLNLCFDWERRSNYEAVKAGLEKHYNSWIVRKPGDADYTRLQHLRVEQIYVTNHTTTTLDASDFMGVSADRGSAEGVAAQVES